MLNVVGVVALLSFHILLHPKYYINISSILAARNSIFVSQNACLTEFYSLWQIAIRHQQSISRKSTYDSVIRTTWGLTSLFNTYNPYFMIIYTISINSGGVGKSIFDNKLGKYEEVYRDNSHSRQ
jgi:hypothetical protein